VNQQQLEQNVPYLLHPRDVIRISNTTFTYEVADTASSKLPASSIPATVHTPSDQNVLSSSSGEANVGEHVGKKLGHYRLVRLIGQGGFAEVYIAEHIHLDTKAAIKLLFTKIAKDDIEAFRLEARTIARLVHPHIVRVLDFGVEGTTPFLVMDYAPGDTIRRLYPKGTRLPLETVVSYAKQVAAALQYAHEQKVIHRDVKPENMLMGRNGEVLLSDFGIALITQSSRYESSIDMAGTIAYMAPEQIEAHPRPASDQYSLGIVVYEWLTGDRPFHGSFREIAIKHGVVPPPPLCKQVPTLPPAVEQVVLIALAKEPKLRFGSVLAFATALEQASQVKQSQPEPVVSISETTATNQSRQSTETAIPVIPFSQQAGSEVPAATQGQPQRILPLPRSDQNSSQRRRETNVSSDIQNGPYPPDRITRSAKVLALVSYSLFSVTSLVVLCFKKKQTRFIHFHAWQSLLLTLFIGILSIPCILLYAHSGSYNYNYNYYQAPNPLFLVPFITIGIVYWIVGMIQAGRGKMTKLFPIGYIAALFVRKKDVYNIDLSPFYFNLPLAKFSERFIATLCYVLVGIPGVVYLICRGKSRFVRFHALQSMLFFTPMIVLTVVSIGLILFLLGPVILVGWAMGIYFSLRGKYSKLPFVGNFVERRIDSNNKLK
jgi:serine/threonine protein kinase